MSEKTPRPTPKEAFDDAEKALAEAEQHGIKDNELAPEDDQSFVTTIGARPQRDRLANLHKDGETFALTQIRENAIDSVSVRAKEETGSYSADLTRRPAQGYGEETEVSVDKLKVNRQEGYEHTFSPEAAQKIGGIITARAAGEIIAQAEAQQAQENAAHAPEAALHQGH